MSVEGITIGVYVKLQDYHLKNPGQSKAGEYTFYVNILNRDGSTGNFDPSLLVKSKGAKGPPPIAEPKSLSTTGLFKIEFNEIMLMDPEILSWSSEEGNEGNDIFAFNLEWN